MAPSISSDQIKKIQSQIEEEITSLQLNKSPVELYAPIQYMLSLGGKRVRPMLAALSYQLFNNDIQKIIKPAIAIELFHNFTLIHDDIMDDAPLRRGQATVHEKWNKNTAILSGDASLIKVYELLLHSDEKYTNPLLERFNTCAIEVCEGQQLDMNYEKETTLSEDAYINMIQLKTAVLLGFALEMGGILSNTTEKNKMLLQKMGIFMGIGFQLMDDVLDVYGDHNKVGKQVGGDIINNKKTFLLIKALEEKKYQPTLIDWMNQSQYKPEEKIKVFIDIYNKLNLKEVAEKKIYDYFSKTLDCLNQIEAPLERKHILQEFIHQLKNRIY